MQIQDLILEIDEDNYEDFLENELFGNVNLHIDITEYEKGRKKEKMYELSKLEKELYNTNTKYMIWIVENRGFLWT